MPTQKLQCTTERKLAFQQKWGKGVTKNIPGVQQNKTMVGQLIELIKNETGC